MLDIICRTYSPITNNFFRLNSRHKYFGIRSSSSSEDYGYAVTSHSGQGQTTDRVLINVDTELGEKLVNERLAYVAVSRARYDAQIYTNDQAELARDLSRDYSHSTATDDYSQQHGYAQETIASTPEHSHAAESLGDSGQSPAPDAAQGQSIGIGED